MKDKTITIKKSDIWKYSTFLLLAVVIIGAFVVFNGSNSNKNNSVAVANTGSGSQPSVNAQALLDDDASLGSENAPVVMVEFSDFQCPFCRKFWTETLPLIKSEYIDTGKVKFVYRDFPLSSIHPSAQSAAEAAECVRDQYGDDAFWKMHDKIFQEQNILDGGDPVTGPVRGTAQFTIDDLKNWAEELGYDVSSCLDSQKFRGEVQKDLSDATKAGGRGTPYFVINGRPLSGAQPFSVFKQIIDSELAA